MTIKEIDSVKEEKKNDDIKGKGVKSSLDTLLEKATAAAISSGGQDSESETVKALAAVLLNQVIFIIYY